jgi:hypothetical protein
MDITRYKNVSNLTSEYDVQTISAYIPKIEDLDFKRGYIVRYFIQKANDDNSVIYEVSSNDISKYANNPFFKTVSLNWRLVGSADEIKESNFKSVKLASQKMKALQLYLPNFLQFYQK